MNREHGGRISKEYIDFSTNINPLGCMSGIKERIIQDIDNICFYPNESYPNLIQALGEYLGAQKEHMILGNGANELIYPLLNSIRVEEYLILAPLFEEYIHYVRMQNKKLSIYRHLDITEDTLVEDILDGIRKKKNAQAVLMVNPNNPTGRMIGKKQMLKLLKGLSNLDSYLIVDESFIDFTGREEEGLIDVIRNYPNLILLRSLTKMYGIAGIRLGLLLTSNIEVLQKVSSILQPWNISSLAVSAGFAITKDGSWKNKTREYIQKEKEYLYSNLKKKGLKVYPTSANFLFLEGEANLGVELEKKGIIIRDCSNFTCLCKGYYRIGIQSHKKNEALIGALQEIYG